MSRRRNVTRDSTPNLCGLCPNPTRDGAHLCDTCTDALLADLIDLADWLLTELDATCSGERSSMTGGGSGEGNGFMNWHAIDVRDNIHSTLRKLAACLRGQGWAPMPGMRHLADWLSQRVNRIALHPDAPACARALHEHIRSALRVVDLPPDRTLVGRCPTCDTGRVYADPARSYGRCDTCRAQHDADTLWADTLLILEDRYVTASEAAHLAMVMGIGGDRERVRKRIGQWAVRGQIVQYENDQGATAFRFGDIVARLRERMGT